MQLIMADAKVSDSSWVLSTKNGNGVLHREVCVDGRGLVVRCTLAYINYTVFQGDSRRVVGYGNAQGSHHRHFMGVVEPVEFISFDDTEERFRADWIVFSSKK